MLPENGHIQPDFSALCEREIAGREHSRIIN